MPKTDLFPILHPSPEGRERPPFRIAARCTAALSFSILLAAASLAPAGAQEPDEALPGPSVGPSVRNDGIYLRDDDEAILRDLLDARSALASRRFEEAAERYQALIDRHVDQLLPWSVETLQSARQAVRREIAAAPEELRRAYAARFETKAREELGGSRVTWQPSRLRAVAERFPFTQAGLEAENRLGDLALESGEDGAALASCRRLLDVLPSSAAPARARVRAKAMIALVRLGDARTVRDWLESLPEAERAARVRVRGEERALEEWGRRLVESMTAGGRGEGDAVPAGSSWSFAWSFDHLVPLFEPGEDADLPLRYEPASEAYAWRSLLGEPDDASFPPLHPIVRGGRLFVHDSRRAFAVDVETGKVLWYRDLAPFGPPSRLSRTAFLAAANEDLLVLVHETTPAKEPHRLVVALSAEDGSTRWVRGGPGDPDEALRPLRFCGAPELAEGAVLIGAKAIGNEMKAYAVGLEADSGAVRFVRFLASGPATPEFTMLTGEVPTTSYAAGCLFVGTGLGIVSAVDPVSGEHLWCYRYDRIPMRSGLGKVRTLSYAVPWLDDPLIAAGGRLYTTPIDSPDLYVLLQDPDRATGFAALARRPKGNDRYLLGVRNGVVFLAGNDETDRVPQVTSFHPEGGPEEEAWPPFAIPNLPVERSVQRDDFEGRGVGAGDVLLVPTRKTVYIVSSKTGDLLGEVRTRPEDGAPGELPKSGNVVVGSEAGRASVFIASNDRVLRFRNHR